MSNILQKIKKENLTGKGGASFPVFRKWNEVKKSKAEKKFLACNASEGEPGVLKDAYLLEHFPEKVINGMKIAVKELDITEAFVFINEDYYKKYRKKLETLVHNSNIKLFKKPHIGGYIAGEESSLINTIMGNRIEPDSKPPYPSESGLWGYPTVVDNVETFYEISLIDSDKYRHTRFYTINGDCPWPGVYEFSDKQTIGDILYETKNYPKFDFFVQVGGAASGEVLNSNQLDREVSGSGSIKIYSITKHDPLKIIENWLNFFMNESCGKCAPCREGTYRLVETIKQKEPNWHMFFEILDDLPATSFCPLGRSVPVPIISYFKNVLKNNHDFSLIFNEFYNK